MNCRRTRILAIFRDFLVRGGPFCATVGWAVKSTGLLAEHLRMMARGERPSKRNAEGYVFQLRILQGLCESISEPLALESSWMYSDLEELDEVIEMHAQLWLAFNGFQDRREGRSNTWANDLAPADPCIEALSCIQKFNEALWLQASPHVVTATAFDVVKAVNAIIEALGDLEQTHQDNPFTQ